MGCLQYLKVWFHRALNSCNAEGSDKPLEIGYPTDFRRHDICFEGLTADDQAFIRRKAESDAARLYHMHSTEHTDPPTPTPMSRVDRAVAHARKISGHMRGGSKTNPSMYATGSGVGSTDGNAILLADYLAASESGGNGKDGFSDSITLGGSDVMDAEKEDAGKRCGTEDWKLGKSRQYIV